MDVNKLKLAQAILSTLLCTGNWEAYRDPFEEAINCLRCACKETSETCEAEEPIVLQYTVEESGLVASVTRYGNGEMISNHIAPRANTVEFIKTLEKLGYIRAYTPKQIDSYKAALDNASKRYEEAKANILFGYDSGETYEP